MRLIREDYEKDIESVEKKFTEKLLEFGLNVSDYTYKKDLRDLKKSERANKKEQIKQEKNIFKNEKSKLKQDFLTKLNAFKEKGYDKEHIQENLDKLKQKRLSFLLENKAKSREAKTLYREKCRKLRKDYLTNREKYESNRDEIQKLKEKRSQFIAKKREEIQIIKRQNKLKETPEEKSIRLEKLAELKQEYQNDLNNLKETHANDKIAYRKASKSLNNKYQEERDMIQRTKPSFDNYFSGIQTIFQDPISSLNPRMVVVDIISEGLVIRGEKNKAKIRQKVYDVLQLVD